MHFSHHHQTIFFRPRTRECSKVDVHKAQKNIEILLVTTPKF